MYVICIWYYKLVFIFNSPYILISSVGFCIGESLQTTSPSSVSTLRPEDREFTCYFNAELCGFIHSNYSSPVYQWHTNAKGGK